MASDIFARKRSGEDPESECMSLERALARMAMTYHPDPSVAAKKLKPIVYRHAPTVAAAPLSVSLCNKKEAAYEAEVLFDDAENSAAACFDGEGLCSDENPHFEDSGILLDEEDKATISLKEDADLDLLTDDFAPEGDAIYEDVWDLFDGESFGLDGSMLESDAVEDTLDTTWFEDDAVNDTLDASFFAGEGHGLPFSFNESLFDSGLDLDAETDVHRAPEMLEPEPVSPIAERLEQLLDEELGQELQDSVEMEDLLF